MTEIKNQRTWEINIAAIKAWAKSSLVCLVASPFIYLIIVLFEYPNLFEKLNSASPASFNNLVICLCISGVASVVHFLAFMVIGLPMFLKFYSRADVLLWKWSSGSVIGAKIGGLLLSPFMIADPKNIFLGLGYGMITAWACLINRPDAAQITALESLAIGRRPRSNRTIILNYIKKLLSSLRSISSRFWLKIMRTNNPVTLVIIYSVIYVISICVSSSTAHIMSDRALTSVIIEVGLVINIVYAPPAIYATYLLIGTKKKIEDLIPNMIITISLIVIVSWLSYFFQLHVAFIFLEYLILGIGFYLLIGSRIRSSFTLTTSL